MREIREILGEDNYDIKSMKEAGIDCDIVEDGSTFEENSLIKARAISEYAKDAIILADDSGLEIDALNGEPGVHSARYGGVAHDSERNMNKVLRLLDGVPMEERTARFRTAIVLIMDGEIHTFEGKVEGHILTERHGTGGFGYDPIFKPDEANCAFGEMSAEEKNRISHRGRAVAKLTQFLAQQ